MKMEEISLQTMVKKKKKVDKETAVKKVKPSLPGYLIESNILTRLPVKTLIRFKSICKSWYSLLSDPYFLNIHRQIQHNKITNRVLIEYIFEIRKNPKVVTHSFWPKQSLSSLSQEKSSSSYNDTTISRVAGCCDGIVCLTGWSCNIADKTIDIHISLWNPALRISKVVARIKAPVSHTYGMCIGLGYHNQTNDYNLIIFTINGLTINHVEIYSLNLDSWRKVKLRNSNQHMGVLQFASLGVYVSCYPREGAYCWLAYKCDDERYDIPFLEEKDPRIISFDMKDETFKEMMLPYDSTDGYSGQSTLFLYEDSLAVFYTCFDEATKFCSRSCYIWVMKEYHDQKSWTKLYSFDSQHTYISFRGVVENDLIQLLCGDSCGNDMRDLLIKEVKVVDINKLRVNTMTCPKIINILTKVAGITSLAESLISLNKIEGGHSINIF